MRAHTGQTSRPPAVFTIPELARRWRCRRETVRAYIRSGQLAVLPAPANRIGQRRHYRISLAAVLDFEAGVREAPVVSRRRGRTNGAYREFFPE